MKNRILTWLFDTNKEFFEELMVREFMLKAPPVIEEPAIDFLVKGKERLEKWILFQSYYLQRRSISDKGNSDIYQGAMIYLAILLKVINKKHTPIDEVETIKVDKEKDSKNVASAIDDLRNKGKKPIDKKE